MIWNGWVEADLKLRPGDLVGLDLVWSPVLVGQLVRARWLRVIVNCWGDEVRVCRDGSQPVNTY
jgi:hypothetical protein